jgi:hypothetical protein
MALENAPGTRPESILHGSHLVLVDPELRIRGYYQTESSEATARLLDDFRTL